MKTGMSPILPVPVMNLNENLIEGIADTRYHFKITA
jgi:hypothetical protein